MSRQFTHRAVQSNCSGHLKTKRGLARRRGRKGDDDKEEKERRGGE